RVDERRQVHHTRVPVELTNGLCALLQLPAHLLRIVAPEASFSLSHTKSILLHRWQPPKGTRWKCSASCLERTYRSVRGRLPPTLHTPNQLPRHPEFE